MFRAGFVRIVELHRLTEATTEFENIADFDRFHFFDISSIQAQLGQNLVAIDFFIDSYFSRFVDINNILAGFGHSLKLMTKLRKYASRSKRQIGTIT